MTLLSPIRIDRENRYRIARGVSEWFVANCNECGWRGVKQAKPEEAYADLLAHVEMQDGHATVPAMEEPWQAL